MSQTDVRRHRSNGRSKDRRGDDRSTRGRAELPPQPPGQQVAERITFAVSLAIVLAVAGFVLYQQLFGGDRPATIVATPRLEAVRQQGGLYYLPIRVANEGDETAEAIRINAALANGQGTPEVVELEIDLLAGGGKANGTAIFRNDPTRGELTVRVTSYLEP